MKKRIAVWLGMCAMLLGAAGCKSGAKKVYVDVKIDAEHFPDEIFRSYISEAFDPDGDGVIPAEEVNQIQTIDCSDLGISDLTGIEWFPDLWNLRCPYNQISELDVTKNPELRELYCYGNKLAELDASKNPELQQLNCSENQIKKLNVTMNAELLGLYCYNNEFSELDVSKNLKLRTLDCSGNEISKLDVSKNVKLSTLDCSENKISKLDVSKNMKLEELCCSANRLIELDVSKNKRLTDLECTDNQLTELDLSKNYKLDFLRYSGNSLTHLDISQCRWDINLEEADGVVINREDRYADDGVPIDADHFPDEKFRVYVLTVIDRDGNRILSQKEALGTNAIALYEGVDEGQYIFLDVKAPLGVRDLTGLDYFSGLKRLFCANNELMKLDVSKFPLLESIDCSCNNLDKLDVTKNPELWELNCSNNNLDKLDVTKNPVSDLNCGDNKLTELDVTKNPKLWSLDCRNNKLTKLDLSKTLVDSSGLQADEGVEVIWPVLEEEPNTAMP